MRKSLQRIKSWKKCNFRSKRTTHKMRCSEFWLMIRGYKKPCMPILTFYRPLKRVLDHVLLLVSPFWKSNCLLWTAFLLQGRARLLRLVEPIINTASNAPSDKGLYLSAITTKTYNITSRVKTIWANGDDCCEKYLKNGHVVFIILRYSKKYEFIILRSWNNQRFYFSERFSGARIHYEYLLAHPSLT